ncbi:MAG: ABC transporter permease [Pseudomonadales bacterium]|nr:ABC transporter permease [Pseudomonadales bacterium]
MNTVNARRWRNFKANRRGYVSFIVFMVLFVIALGAEFIANDRPILVMKGGELYLPVWFSYSEQELGGELPTEANYRDPYVIELIEADGWMLWPPVRFSFDTVDWEIDQPLPAPPGARHLLGTDAMGTDVFAKLLYGFRLSVLFGLTLTIVSSVIGILVGSLQGYFGGMVDLLGQRFVEIWSGLPILFVLIILASMVEPNVYWLLAILSAFSWMALVGVVRAEFLRARNFDFVRAARALGVSNPVIMVRHVLPNAMVATLTFLPFILNASIATLTALDFLGFGLPVTSPSLGRLLAQARANLQAPWLGLTAFFALATILTLLIFIGEAVRDALDPRRTQRSR